MMFDDVHEIQQVRKKYNAKMYLSGISTFRELAQIEKNALKNGALEQKYKELIALGISISNGCYG
jgi:alkylhydroperoxidase/carboxymuconolactone decarboxylase family protein YurZ